MGQQTSDVWRELVSLHQRWGKISKITEGDNIRAQACSDSSASRLFTRIVQRKILPWEKDSIARAAYDPAHIPDCNVQATVGQHFLFNEPIQKAMNGRRYLRVTKKSLYVKSPPNDVASTAPRLNETNTSRNTSPEYTRGQRLQNPNMANSERSTLQ